MRTQVVIDLDFDEGRGELTVRVGASERILLTEGTTGPLTALLSALLEERPPVWLQSAGELVSCSQTLREGRFGWVREQGRLAETLSLEVSDLIKVRQEEMEIKAVSRGLVGIIARHAEGLEKER